MLTHIRLDSKMETAIEEILEKELYNNKSEFIRTAIREKIEHYKTVRAKELLEKKFRNFHGERPTKEERVQAAEELIKLKKL
jgi:Arc/MetJ-type ribon-helix-helix transcriptional regulator